MDKFAIVSVWYHKNEFIYNTKKFPFWHNVLYNSTQYKYYIVHHVESEITLPQCENIQFVSFDEVCPRHEMHRLQNVVNKINYMKLMVLFNPNFATEERLLLMDMDCNIVRVDQLRLLRSPLYLEPFFNPICEQLYEYRSSYDAYRNSFDSYVEMYAMLINKRNRFFQPMHGVNVVTDNETNEFFMISQYMNILQLYMCMFHNYPLPHNVCDINIPKCIVLTFSRNHSFSLHNKDDALNLCSDIHTPPVFQDVNCYLRRLISAKDPNKIEEITRILHTLRTFSYNFTSIFASSDIQDSYVNLYGYLVENYGDAFDHLDFIKPVMYIN
ncbi:hypothetical protein SlGVgp120 [Spodoptera litura granulovirus]|uniref:Uncharacterized protein n=1 Tax=Spodoptera litura granulovirus TaxID=359919 RepID=A5IZX2_9BBAC|nr:hypothetical protein SlGVgp120 [Spodoptera litura granulovirus]ABQ52063.1 hypothetical protein SlGVgp120 [Spodoptera litura granulovirus]